MDLDLDVVLLHAVIANAMLSLGGRALEEISIMITTVWTNLTKFEF